MHHPCAHQHPHQLQRPPTTETRLQLQCTRFLQQDKPLAAWGAARQRWRPLRARNAAAKAAATSCCRGARTAAAAVRLSTVSDLLFAGLAAACCYLPPLLQLTGFWRWPLLLQAVPRQCSCQRLAARRPSSSQEQEQQLVSLLGWAARGRRQLTAGGARSERR